MSNKENLIPIVFIHKGYSWYLNYSLSQAASYNKSSPIFLLGNDQTNRSGSVNFINIEKYNNATKEFKKYYRHISTNDAEIESFCFERWFYLRALMREYGLKKIFTCDSDVMLYCNVAEQDRWLGAYTAAYSIPHNQENFRLGASAHVSYWTLEGIEGFCTSIISIYSGEKFPQEVEDKSNYTITNNHHGGISDMVLLHLFSRGQNIVNLSAIRENTVYDDNINTSENYFPQEYLVENNCKKIIWKDRSPYGINLLQNKEIKFNALHFQGVAKNLMVDFYKLNQGWVKAMKVKWKIKAERSIGKMKGRIKG